MKLRFHIFKQDGKYHGKLLWASNIFEPDGVTPKKDFKNPNKSLQTRTRQGIVNIANLKYSDGDSYSLNAKLKQLTNFTLGAI